MKRVPVGIWVSALGAAIAVSGAAAQAGAVAVGEDAAGPLTLVPRRSLWPGVVIIVLVALFVTAAVAGPLIRANLRDPSESDPGPRRP